MRWETLSNLRRCFLATAFFLAGCKKAVDLGIPDTSPVGIFDACWQAIDRNYALFPVKNINWDSVYARYRPDLTMESTSAETFHIADQMLSSLRDGHVALETATDTAVYDGFYQPYARNFNLGNILTNYLHNSFVRVGPLICKVVGHTGYVYYNSFQNDVSDSQLDSVFGAFREVTGLIVDVRSNTGGKSGNADRFFQRFLPATRTVKYEREKSGSGHDDLSAPRPYTLGPLGETFDRPVVVLTNRLCYSACNDFVLYMSGLSNVVLVGDRTGGGGGIPQDYLLANGWKLQYTATETLGPDGLSVEAGIVPKYYQVITSLEEVNGQDPILQFAYDYLQ